MNAPILSRTMLTEKLRDGTFRQLDWNLVGTSLGVMLEPRSLIRNGGAIVNEDVYDRAYTGTLSVDGATAGQLVLAGLSTQWPRTFNAL